MTKSEKQARFGLAHVLVAVILCVAALPAMARSAFDFDVNHIPISYVTRGSTVANALTNSSAHTWLRASGRIEMSVTLTSTSGNQVIFAQGGWELLLVNGLWRLGYKNDYYGASWNAGTGRWNQVTPTANTTYGIVCERKDGKLYLTINDVVLVDGVAATTEPGTGVGLTFFHRKNGGNWNDSPSKMRFHYAKIYNDGVQEAEYVPCIYKVFYGGIYDTVGGVDDYSSSSVVGFDWDERAEKLHEKFCNMGKADGGEEIDWVRSAGTEFLQTDFVPDSTDVIKMKFAVTGTGRHHAIFSAGGSGNNCNMMELLCLSAGTWRPSFKASDSSAAGTWTTNVDYEVEYSAAGGFKVDGTVVKATMANASSAGTFSPAYGLTFFSRIMLQSATADINPLSEAGVYKFYWAKVYASDGTTLKADFVPYVDGDGFAGIKDKVSGKVFLPLFGRCVANNGARPQAVYVAPGTAGDDTNAGTIRSPFKTFDKAQKATTAGGSVYLKDGTYNTGVCVWFEGDGAHSIIGASGDPKKVIVNSTAASTRAFCARYGGAFRNLTFQNFSGGMDGSALYVTGGVYVDNCVFVSNTVSLSYSTSLGGILYVDSSTVRRCVFRNNLASGTAAFGSGAVLLGNSKAENCLFEDNVADGPETRCCTVYVAGTAAIRNCTFAKNSARATTSDSTAGIYFGSANARVVNTVFYGNGHSLGASLEHSVGRFMNGSYDTAFVSCAADYQINSGCRIIDGAAFADWANGDYAPHEKSRLINRGFAYLDAGATPEQYGIDLLGNPRYVGTGIDIGAYEWQGKDPVIGLIFVLR